MPMSQAQSAATSQTRPTFSVVVPIWNEEEVIPELYRRIVQIMDETGEPWELVCVNDGSRDRSLQLLVELHERDPRVKILDFSRNFGHQIAITAGADFAQGDAVIVMDADLQDPPEVVARMIEKWRAGYEVVYAVRAGREGETKFKLWTASLFYRLLQRITDVDIPLDTGDFRLMDRRVVLAMRQLREQYRFMRGLSSWVGFRQIGIEYERAKRYAGETKYPLTQDAPAGDIGYHGLQLCPAATGDLFRLYPGAAQPGRHRPDRDLAAFRQQFLPGPGHDAGFRALLGRRPTHFSRYHRRVSGPHL